MATIFQDARHGLYWITTLFLKVAADSQNDLGCTELSECEFDSINNQNVQMFALWKPFYNMAVIDNDK